MACCWIITDLLYIYYLYYIFITYLLYIYDIFPASCDQMGLEVTWTFIEIQMMTLYCFKESCLNDHKNVYLSLNDVFIDGHDLVRMGCPWSEDLKSLTVKSPLRSLDIQNEHRLETLEDIANSVTLFNTIQKVVFGECSRNRCGPAFLRA